MIDVEPIKAFSDNYIWLLRDAHGHALVVDPGEASPVIAHLDASGLKLCGILITHHHHDHVGGLTELQARYSVPAWSPRDPRIPGEFEIVEDGDTVAINAPEIAFEVVALPGHTLTHIAYVNQSMAFVGDTLFSVGCGRLFEGTPAQMLNSLSRIAQLPDDTMIYCAHEYTESNCRFALSVEPENADLIARYQTVRHLREQDRPTVPTTLGEELRTNPFLRWDCKTVRDSAERHAGRALASDTEVFAEIRAWKDAA